MTVSAPPAVLDENIPAPLKTGKRHTAWRFEARRGQAKPAKMPYSPDAPKGASSTDPTTWTTFEDAVKYARVAGLDGIMRAFDHADGLVGTDLDNCLDPSIPEPGIDDLAPWAAEYVRRLDTYTEVSPTGTGVKLWARGTMPAFGHKRGDVEMYGSTPGGTGPCGRLFTQTGRRLKGTPAEVQYRPDAILAIHREVFGEAADPVADLADPGRPIPALELGDDDVIRLASTSPHQGEKFRRLWSGDSSDYATDGNDGESEADCALCEILFYYGGPDRDRADRLFRRSGLYRDKWERADYRKRTFDRALKGKTRFHGDSIRPPAVGSDGATGCTCEDCPDRTEATRLRRLLLDREDMIEDRDTTIRVQRERLTELRERLANWKAVLSNPKLKPADRIVAIPLIEQVRNAQRAGQAEIHVRYTGIVNGWGLPESTVQKSAAVLTDMPAAPLAKRHTQEPVRYEDPKTGEPIVSTPTKVLYRALADGDLFKVVARYDPGLPQRGGQRHPLEHCPEHPDADLKVRHVKHCSVCRRPVGEPSETTLRLQNDALETDSPTVAVDATDGRQNEALDDERAAAMVATDTGRDVDTWKRVSTKAPIDFEAIREARERAAEVDPPDWLEEWPDPEVAPVTHCTRAGCDRPSANGFVCAGHLRGETFAPSPEWQEVPDGYPCPPGGEFRMDFATGKNYARWPVVAAVSGGSE